MNDTVIINGSNVSRNFDGLCVGDVNASNVPPLKSNSKIDLDYQDSQDYQDIMRLNSNKMFELPLIATSNLSVGAISLILKFPKEMITIDNLQLIIDNDKLKIKNEELRMKNEEDNLVYNVVGDELRVGWYADAETQGLASLHSNTPVIIIRGKTTGNFKEGDVIKFSIGNSPLCEFADEFGNPIDNVVLKTFTIEHTLRQNIGSIESDNRNDLFIYPNPADDKVNLRFNIANDGFVKISLYNVLGEKVIDVIDKFELKGVNSSELNLESISPGVYMCKMVLDGRIVITKRLIITK